MADTLQDTIRGIRRRAWIAKFFYGCGWILSITTGFLLLVAGVDFILRQDDRLSRLTLSLLFVLAITTFIARLLLPLVRQRLTDVILAQRIQQRFPALKHKIATAVEFLQDEQNAVAGSGAMRREVIREATDELHDLPVREVVHYRHARIAIGAGLVSFAILLTIVLASPIGSQIAMARLINPFGETVWPQVNDLAFQNTPSHVPLGGLFEAEIIDRDNHLPQTVNIEYRFEEEGVVRTLVEPMNRVRGMMVTQRQNVQSPFHFRAVGGDDQTEWHPLQTVIPPALETIAFEVQPPAYTGWHAQKHTQNLWGIAGSEVTLKGTSSVPLASATLITEGEDSIPLEVNAREFRLTPGGETWKLKNTGSVFLRLVDQHGITGGERERIAVRVLPESAPTVQIEKPEGFYRASPDAILPLEIFAKDNLAIRDIELHFQQRGDTAQKLEPILLFERPQNAPTFSRDAIERQLAEGDQQLVKYAWDLAPHQWEAGTEVSFYATAHDDQPAEGRSAPEHTLQIVDKEQLAQEMVLRQQGLLAELARIVAREKESNEQTTHLEIAWQQMGFFTQTEIQALRGVELTEREIRRAVSDQQDGLQTRIATLEADLTHNRINDPIMSGQLQRVRETLNRVEKEQLSPLQSALNAARKHAQNESASSSKANRKEKIPPEGARALAQARTHQEQAIESLQPLINELLRFNQYRRMAGQLAAITERQGNIRESTERLAATLSGQRFEQLEAKDRVALQQTAEQQENLNRELEGLLARMQQTAKNLHGEDRKAAARLKAAVSQGRQQGLGKQMRAAHKHLEGNQTGQAITRQKQAAATLQTMLDTLRGVAQKDLKQWVEKLRQAEAELARLAEEQLSIEKKQAVALAQAQAGNDSTGSEKELKAINQQRESLEDKIQDLAERVEGLQAAEAAKSLDAAANKSRQAGKAAQQGDATGSGQQDRAAAKHMADARKQLADARQQAEAEQLDAQLSRLPEQLAQLLENQQNLLRKTENVAAQYREKIKLTRVEKANVVDLSRAQLALVAQIQPIKEGLTLAEILQYVLAGAAAKMQTAAEKLGQFQTGPQTQDLQRAAIRQLEMVLTSLERNTDEEEAEKQDGNSGGGQGGGGAEQQEGTKRSLAEIRLLKLLQMDLNHRIESIQREIETVTDNGDVAPLIDQLHQLGPEQAKLAIWTLGLLREEDQDREKGNNADPKRTEL